MLRRLLPTLALSLVLAGLSVLGPHQAGASTARHVAIRHDLVTRAVDGVTTVALAHPATSVAAYWQGNPHAQVTLAFSSDGVHFGTAQAAGRDELGGQRGNGTTYGALHSTTGARAVRVATDRPIAQLSVLGLSDGTTATSTSPAPTSSAGAAVAATPEPPVVSRDGWGADPAYMTWAPQFYATRKLVVHHTDTSDDYQDRAGAEAQIRSIYYYHSVTQTWGDIGYNFLIDKFGTIYEGRYSRDYAGANPTGDDPTGKGVTGAHTSGWNSGTVGIALLGTLTTHDATPAARDALERLLAWEAGRNGIAPEATQSFVNPVSGASITTPNIAGHRDYVATACPGDTFYPTLPTIRHDVALMVSGGTPPPAPAPDTTAPTAPTNLRASATRTQVSASWSAAKDNVAVARYEVWRSKGTTAAFAYVGSTTGTSSTSGTLSRRTTYYLKVRAVDTSGNVGPFSSTVSARTG